MADQNVELDVLETDEPQLTEYTSESTGPVGENGEVRRPSASAPGAATARAALAERRT